MLFQSLSGDFHGAQSCSKGDRGGPLDIVVKGQQFVAVSLEDRPRMWSREIFPLQAGAGKFLLHCLHELIYEIKVGLTRDSFVAPAKVLRIVESFRIVGPHIQDDR